MSPTGGDDDAGARRQRAISALYRRIDASDWEAALALSEGLGDDTVFRAFARDDADVPMAVLLRLLAREGVPGRWMVLFQKLSRRGGPELIAFLKARLDARSIELLARLKDPAAQDCVLGLLSGSGVPAALAAAEALGRTGEAAHEEALRREVERRPGGDPVRRAIIEEFLKRQPQDPELALRQYVRGVGLGATLDERFPRLRELDYQLSLLYEGYPDLGRLSAAVVEEAGRLPQAGWTAVERGLLRDILRRRCGAAAKARLGWDDWNYAVIEAFELARFKASTAGMQIMGFLALLWLYRKALAWLLGPLPPGPARAALGAGVLWFGAVLSSYRNDICGFGTRPETPSELVAAARGFWLLNAAMPLFILHLHLMR